MSWSTIRQATTEDQVRLDAAAARFIARHNLNPHGFEDFSLDLELTDMSGDSEGEEHRKRHLRRLWLRVVRRTLGSPNAEGIAYGYVGQHAD